MESFLLLLFLAIDFNKDVYPVLETANCRACHTSDGVASGTRLHFPEPGASPERVAAFGKSLVKLVDAKQPDQSLLLRKPTARIPHAGGQKIPPGTPGEQALQAWVKELTTLTADQIAAALNTKEETAGHYKGAAIRRLTNSQYNNTVRDLLGVRTAPANQFPPEDFVNGFKNQYDAQSLSPMLVDAYGAAAEGIAKRVTIANTPDFVRSFGMKAFRRPLTPEEVKRYDALLAKEGPRLVVEVMLQSPNFLFRMEETNHPAWKPYATASRLSYALWDTMPDDALFQSAARGELNTKAGVEATVRRMLADPKAKQAFDEFVSQWMRFDRVLTSTKDRRSFPNFTSDTAAAMTKETRLFLSDLVWNDRNFMEMYTADYGYVNGDLARLYGVEPPAEEFAKVQFPPTSERAGLLGQALFLTLTSKPDDTSPTARGLFVREQLLCQHVPDPPPGVNTNLPPVSEAKPKSNRERLGEHTTNGSCAGCHSLIDPIGFGLEKFDAIGARREKQRIAIAQGEGEEKKRKYVEAELDTRGMVAGIANSAFDSPRQLGAVLAGSSICQECIVKQYFRYVNGRLETPADRPLLRAVTERFRLSGFRFKELVVSMLSTQEPSDVADHNEAR